MKRQFRLLFVILWLTVWQLFSISPALAATVQLSGTVTDGFGHAISGATVTVLDPSSSATITSATTDSGGNYSLSFSQGTYNVQVTPPTGSGFTPAIALNQAIINTRVLNFVLVPAGSVTLSGHLFDGQGNPLAGLTVQLQDASGHQTTTTTTSSGAYSVQVAPGTYSLLIRNSGTAFASAAPFFTVGTACGTCLPLTQNTTLDLTLPFKQVSIHVQDPAGNPVANAGIATGFTTNQNLLPGSPTLSGGSDYRSTNSQYLVSTDASGNATLWLFPTDSASGGDQYILNVVPPPGSPFTTISVQNVTFTSSITEIIVLQFVHAPPITTITITPAPNAQAIYPSPVTVSLSASAATNFTIAATYYSVDNGTTQTYSTPFTVAGEGTHTINYWSIDNIGVFEIPKTRTLYINVPPAVGAITPLANPIVAGAGFSVSASFTDPGTQDTFTATFDWGDGTTSAGNVSVSTGGGLVDGTHNYRTPGTFTISLTVTDKDGAIGQSQVTVQANEPLTASAGGPYDVNEGGTVTVTATGTSPTGETLDYAWDLDNNGTFETAGQSVTFSAATLDGPGTRTITVKVTDGAGNSITAQATVNILNAPPTVGTNTPSANPIALNTPLTVSAPFTDPGTQDTHTATIDWGDGTTSIGTVTESHGSGSVGGTHTYPAAGTYTITVTVTDQDGATGQSEVRVQVNQPPTANAGGPYYVNEGGTITVTATGSDPEGDTLSYAWDLDNNGTFETAGQSVTFSAAGLDGPGTLTITVKVTDSVGNSTTAPATVHILNVAPIIGPITAPVDPVAVNTSIATSASFTDAGIHDTHTAVWNWGDGHTSTGTVTEVYGSGSVSGSHTYAAAGVYTVTLTVTDKDGASSQATFQYVVVYNPNGGFVTGGGWVTSPAGACPAQPSATGKLNFGFNAKYQNGSSVPTGSTQVTFQACNLDFHSTGYQWLVVSGSQAQLKGTGTINGGGNYTFLLTVVDGGQPGSAGDTFRLKIWDTATGTVIYDSQPGAPDMATPTIVLGGGNIMIHS